MQLGRRARPWQNGRIERPVGTLKTALRGYAIADVRHLDLSLAQFRFGYNTVRPHQHLAGTPHCERGGASDPYRRLPEPAPRFETVEWLATGLCAAQLAAQSALASELLKKIADFYGIGQ